MCVPRTVTVGSAGGDMLSDSDLQFLSLVLADEVYRNFGCSGFIHGGEMPGESALFADGDLCCFKRIGRGEISRRDISMYLDIIDKNLFDRQMLINRHFPCLFSYGCGIKFRFCGYIG